LATLRMSLAESAGENSGQWSVVGGEWLVTLEGRPMALLAADH